jgi:hypothetical protein
MIRTVMGLTTILFAASCAAGPVDPIGEWGGDHIALTVGPAESVLELDCATGRINGAFMVSSDGRFDLEGVFVREHGGPVREGEVLAETRARHAGAIRGRRMTLELPAGAAQGEPPLHIASYLL